MNIELKNSAQIAKMRQAGLICGRVLSHLEALIKPGISTHLLDFEAQKIISAHNAEASFKGYKNYPKTLCISINEEVVHGIPSNRLIKEGDIVGVDIGVKFQGYHADTAITVPVGKISPEARKLMAVTKKALMEGIRMARAGQYLGDIEEAIQKTVEENGYSVIRDLVGHGVGKNLQEDPPIPNYGKAGTGPKLLPGMTLAIEPMVALGKHDVHVLEDGWTVVTDDGSLSAHFEHTILITEGAAEILTNQEIS